VHRSGRPVTLAVGEHVRMPRVYRGRDVMWWMERSGVLDERYDEVDDIVRARHLSSPQLVGTPERATLDLNTLTDRGVKLVGRLAGIADTKAQFSGSLRNKTTLADQKLGRLLTRSTSGPTHGYRRGGGASPPFRPHPGGGVAAALPRPHLRGDQDHPVGERVPARLFVAAPSR
jgi:hypothetical protein